MDTLSKFAFPGILYSASAGVAGEMKIARRITSSFLGIYAGLLACQHGIFEIQQGPRISGGLMIQAIGAPCQPETMWHSCYPAMTLIPNLLISGIIAVIAGLSVLIWAAAFVSRKHGGLILALLSLALLLVGGGFVPFYVGIVASVTASRLHAPVKPLRVGLRWLAQLWPWTLILIAVWFPGSWLLGYFFSQTMLALSGFLFLFFSVGLPVLAAFSGFAADWE
jgi:hypothetical protein